MDSKHHLYIYPSALSKVLGDQACAGTLEYPEFVFAKQGSNDKFSFAPDVSCSYRHPEKGPEQDFSLFSSLYIWKPLAELQEKHPQVLDLDISKQPGWNTATATLTSEQRVHFCPAKAQTYFGESTLFRFHKIRKPFSMLFFTWMWNAVILGMQSRKWILFCLIRKYFW